MATISTSDILDTGALDWQSIQKKDHEFRNVKKAIKKHSTMFPKKSWQFIKIRESNLWRAIIIYILKSF